MLRACHLHNWLLVILVALAFSLSSVAQVKCTSDVAGWSYDDVSRWATKYPSCCSQTNPGSSDVQQSPINIASATQSADLTLEVNYNGVDVPVVDNGHSIEVEYQHTPPGSKKNQIRYNGKVYALQQFHFHQPNEHQIPGEPKDPKDPKDTQPMEVHLVHQATDGRLLVIGVLVNQGAANEGFGKILAHIGGHENLNPIQMIPGTHNTNQLKFYTYMGSLTTPACAPPVTWVVLKEPITFSADQIRSYGDLHNGKYAQTSRGPQPAITDLKVYSNFKP
jgi:carbonic anhydrase